MTKSEYKAKSVELLYASKGFADNVTMPEFLRSMAVQQYMFGIRDKEFDTQTRAGLTAIMTIGDISEVFEKE